MEIIVERKPTTGRFDRACVVCGETYNGWNMYRCHDCERLNVTIVEAWLAEYGL